jgi:hypothetical protein
MTMMMMMTTLLLLLNQFNRPLNKLHLLSRLMQKLSSLKMVSQATSMKFQQETMIWLMEPNRKTHSKSLKTKLQPSTTTSIQSETKPLSTMKMVSQAIKRQICYVAESDPTHDPHDKSQMTMMTMTSKMPWGMTVSTPNHKLLSSFHKLNHSLCFPPSKINDSRR